MTGTLLVAGVVTKPQLCLFQHVETQEREVVQEFPQNWREQVVGDFGGREQREALGHESLRR